MSATCKTTATESMGEGAFRNNINSKLALAFKPMNDKETALMHLLQSHFPSQALYAIVQLGIPDILGDSYLTIAEVAEQLGVASINRDALLRIFRLLTTVGIIQQRLLDDYLIEFGLSAMGKLLRTNHPNSMTAFAHYWLDPALFRTWTELPDVLAGIYDTNEVTPFEKTNEGRHIIEYYQENEKAAMYAGQVVNRVSPEEIPAVLECVDWNAFVGKTVVDVGGGHGALMEAVHKKHSGITCVSLDLPEVIAEAPSAPEGVILVPGDMFEPSTIPNCDVIVTKHVLCDWYDKDVLSVLKSFHEALADDGKLIIGDAVLVDGEQANNLKQAMVSMDVQLLLVGGGKMQRSKSQWADLGSRAGFRLDSVAFPRSPTLHILSFTKTKGVHP